MSVFLKCNKLARLTHDPDDVVKALRKSKLLEVTEDGTKVRRTVVVQDKPDVDECTIYVVSTPCISDKMRLLRSITKIIILVSNKILGTKINNL